MDFYAFCGNYDRYITNKMCTNIEVISFYTILLWFEALNYHHIGGTC